MLAKPIVVCHVSDPEKVGIAMSENILTVPDQNNPGGFSFKTLLGVAWNHQRSPALAYHSPDELVWLRIYGDEVDGESDEDEVSEVSDEVTEEVQATN